jgi:hypothetical protein
MQDDTNHKIRKSCLNGRKWHCSRSSCTSNRVKADYTMNYVLVKWEMNRLQLAQLATDVPFACSR